MKKITNNDSVGRYVFWFTIFYGVLFLCYNINDAIQIVIQDIEINKLKPFRATVLKAEYKNHTGKTWRRNRYYPIITYEYVFNDANYVNDRYSVYDKPAMLKKGELETLLKNYPEGHSIEIWLDPNNPKMSVVSNTYTIYPYGRLLFFHIPLIGALFYYIKPDEEERHRFLKCMMLNLTMFTTGVLCCLHYYSRPTAPVSIGGILGFSHYFCLNLIFIWFTFRGRLLNIREINIKKETL